MKISVSTIGESKNSMIIEGIINTLGNISMLTKANKESIITSLTNIHTELGDATGSSSVSERVSLLFGRESARRNHVTAAMLAIPNVISLLNECPVGRFLNAESKDKYFNSSAEVLRKVKEHMEAVKL